MTTYVLCPGPVVSKTDGQRRWVDSHRLAWLYSVKWEDCVVMPSNHGTGFGPIWTPPEDAVYLRPREDGYYTLPEAPK